jgi:hypothetical protein
LRPNRLRQMLEDRAAGRLGEGIQNIVRNHLHF